MQGADASAWPLCLLESQEIILLQELVFHDELEPRDFTSLTNTSLPARTWPITKSLLFPSIRSKSILQRSAHCTRWDGRPP
jgi:hypothetical protein